MAAASPRSRRKLPLTRSAKLTFIFRSTFSLNMPKCRANPSSAAILLCILSAASLTHGSSGARCTAAAVAVLRTATKPLTAREIAERVLVAANVTNLNKAALADLKGSVLASLRNHKGKGRAD